MKAEWRGRSDFAEFAEALDINTDDVMAMLPFPLPDGTVLFTVVYTTDPDGVDAWIASLTRGDDGVLKVMKKTFHPEFMDEINKGIRQRLYDELGPPTGRDDADQGT